MATYKDCKDTIKDALSGNTMGISVDDHYTLATALREIETAELLSRLDKKNLMALAIALGDK